MDTTILSGSAVGLFLVYLGRTLYELSRQRSSGQVHLACSVSVQELLERQTRILEALSASSAKTNERVAILMEMHRQGIRVHNAARILGED